jgi:predicted nucleotidyltransferase
MRDVLNEGLAAVAERIRLALVYGSIARGDETGSSDVDLMVVGEVSFADVSSVGRSIQPYMGRKSFVKSSLPRIIFFQR